MQSRTEGSRPGLRPVPLVLAARHFVPDAASPLRLRRPELCPVIRACPCCPASPPVW